MVVEVGLSAFDERLGFRRGEGARFLLGFPSRGRVYSVRELLPA
jgi:hypothetical protein